MTARIGSVLAGIACLLVIVSLPAGTVSGQSSPSISLEINQRDVSDGDSIRISERPTLDIDVSADTAIDVVRVMVDGEARKSFSPESTSFRETVELATDDGDHEIGLVVSADGTTTFSVSVLQDRIPPFVSYTSPFTTRNRPPPESDTVGNGTISIAGEFDDATGVDVIYIEQTQRFTHLGTNTQSESFSIRDPGDTFSREFFLGPDPVQNEFTIAYVDGVGNRREHVTTLNVSDERTPTLNVAHPEESDERIVEITGSASDNTQLQEIYVENDGVKQYILSAPKPAPNPSNQRHRFSYRLSGANALRDGTNDFVVGATDYGGNTQTVEFSIRYVFTVEPVTRIDREATELTGDGIRVVGRVDSGEVESVVLESARAGRDESADLVNVYSGAPKRLVDVNHTVGLVDGPTDVRLRAIDANGDEHVTTLTVEDGAITFPPEPEPPAPDTTVTTSEATATPAPPTASATPGEAANGTATATPTPAPSGDDGSGSGGGAPPVTNTETSTQTPGFGVTDALVALAIGLAAIGASRFRRGT